MADKCSFSWNATITKGGKSDQFKSSYSYTPASIYKGKGVRQAIPNSWTALTFPGASTIAFFSVDNLDPSNAVDLATANDGTGIFATVAASGTQPVFVKAGATYYAKSSTGTVNIEKGYDGAS